MKNDMNDLKKLVHDLMQKEPEQSEFSNDNEHLIRKIYGNIEPVVAPASISKTFDIKRTEEVNIQDTEEVLEESLSLSDKEMEMIKKALEKYSGKRKQAANELGISERTLYRKIKEYNLE
jgi:transcriptional regulator with PAS, ATPase and Fis domain